jgi:hypothetical protein
MNDDMPDWPQYVSCAICGKTAADTCLRYVYDPIDMDVRCYCTEHYRQSLVDVYGEETVKMMEESTDYHDALTVGKD